jgi:hypothetical protein
VYWLQKGSAKLCSIQALSLSGLPTIQHSLSVKAVVALKAGRLLVHACSGHPEGRLAHDRSQEGLAGAIRQEGRVKMEELKEAAASVYFLDVKISKLSEKVRDCLRVECVQEAIFKLEVYGLRELGSRLDLGLVVFVC